MVGDSVLPFRRHTGFESWNRYAAVNDEFVSIHMDHEAGRAAGYPGAIGMGNLHSAYLHNMLRDWGEPDARIRSLRCRFRAPNLNGVTVAASGRVTAIRILRAQRVIDLNVWVEDEHGHMLTTGSATVELRCS
jgi:acyl dehydratase